jgi:hypothetical protein
VSSRVQRQARTYDRLAVKYGLATSQERLAGPRRYRWDLIERDVKVLLARRRHLPLGRSKTYPESLVNYIASIYLGCCEIEQRAPFPELVHLISQQLEVADFGVKGAKEAVLIAAQQLRCDNPQISNTALAKKLKIDKATVGRWVNYGLLQARTSP